MKACPTCSAPVTFGGGSTMQYGCRSDPAIAPKYPRRSHSSYQRASAACASYAGGISVLMESPSLGDEPTEALSSVSHPAATLSDR